ncbi:MAG: MFS transporter [Alphaproteobacteria bacterium]
MRETQGKTRDKQLSGAETDGPAEASDRLPHRVTTPGERTRAFVILFASLTCLGMGQTVIFATLPPLSRQLGMIDFQVGAIFMVSAVLWLFTSPYWGRRSDVMGRKPVILIGLGGFAVSTALFAGILGLGVEGMLPLAVLYPALILSRTVFGTLGPGANSAAQAYVADRTDPEQRTSALAGLGAAFVLGTTMGPGMVWVMSGFGLLAPMFGVAGLGALSCLAILLFLPERTRPKERDERPHLRLWDPRVREPLTICILLSVSQAVPVQTITFLFLDRFSDDPGLAAAMAAEALLASSLGMLIVQLGVLPRLGWPERRLMRVGTALAACGYGLLVASPNPGAVILAMVFVGIGFAMARSGGVGAASLAVTPDEQGGVAGLIGATGGAGFVVAPLVAFPLYAIAPSAPFALCFTIVTGIIVWLWVTSDRAVDP